MNIPDITHWAIITTEQVYVPGDERSRTNPGHGYPEHYEETINYESYVDYMKFCDRVTQLTIRDRKFKAVQVTPMTVEKKITVSLKQ